MTLPAPRPDAAALVTGASGGIGAAIADELAARGHNIVLVARRPEQLREVADSVVSHHDVRAETLACDLTDQAAREALPEAMSDLGFETEVLVNNAGFATGGAFHESDPGRELQQVRLDVEAVVALTSLFAPAMVERRRGAILNVASTAGMQPLPFSAGYSAAKAYVLTFSEAIHEELKGHGVTVTALCPGPVSTEFWEVANWQVGGSSFERAVPSVAWISAEEAAKAGVAGLEASRRVVVPGLPIRAAMIASRYIPHAIKLPTIALAMRRR